MRPRGSPKPARTAKVGISGSVIGPSKDWVSSKSSCSGIRGVAKGSVVSTSSWLSAKDIVKELCDG